MALLHIDDFAGYGNGAETILTAGIYAGVSARSVGGGHFSFITDPDGISTKRCLKVANSGQNTRSLLRRVLPSPRTTIGLSTRVWYDVLPSQGRNYPLCLLSNGTQILFHMVVTAIGQIFIVRGDVNTGLFGVGGLPSENIVAASDGPIITAKGWWHIEWKTVIGSGGSGSVEVRVEGRQVPGLTRIGIDTGISPIIQVGLGQGGESGGFGFDHLQKDYVAWDDFGTDVNDFIGPAIVHRHTLVSSVGDEWEFQGGSSPIAILNSAPPSPTRYVFADVANTPSQFRATISPLPNNVTRVRGVMLRAQAAKNDGGDASLQNGFIVDPGPDEVIQNGPDRPLTISQIFYDDFSTRNPKTNLEWRPEEIDELVVQMRRLT